ncbi:prohead protease [Burkholderia phage vB_BceS_AH2]|uniref:Prohead protease n=1 Tax=Burkholderia phage vB_BceS_AH2 TaxID=1133022 RepID=I6NTP0_9CAUD|nr:head maturation protease [Burkholderia phage vB_BceS_AH2]AEY69574.1 prohead protease [Burkholderia phage vB_BceS_AH2]
MNATRNSARLNVRAIIDGMNMKAAMLAPHYSGLASALQEFADADRSLEEAAWEARKNDLTMAYGFGPASADKPFAFANGIAIIPVHGVLINRFSYSWGFVTGYNFIRTQYDAALNDEDVKLIVFDCNSYGGMVAGCFETVDEIFAGRDKKPSIAMVDSNSYSACYAIASAANRVVVTQSSGVGSIGVVAMHMNVSDMLKQWGIEITFIFAGAHKVDGNPYEALSPDVKKTIQASINKSYATFVNSVARNRNISADAVRATEAQTYDAEDALAIGLIDAIQSPATALEAYLDELSGSDDQDQQEQDMSDKTTQPGAEGNSAIDEKAVAASARTAERERMAGILNCEEAKGKSKLANHLALNTEMSVEDAKAMLAVAAPEQTQAAAPTQEKNHFADAMNASKHPEVGAGDGDADAGADASKGGSAASRILAAQEAATGRKVAAK